MLALKKTRSQWSGKLPLERICLNYRQLHNGELDCGNKLSEWSLFKRIRREWARVHYLCVVWHVLATKVLINGTNECSSSGHTSTLDCVRQFTNDLSNSEEPKWGYSEGQNLVWRVRQIRPRSEQVESLSTGNAEMTPTKRRSLAINSASTPDNRLHVSPQPANKLQLGKDSSKSLSDVCFQYFYFIFLLFVLI